jgi:energy-coupling factor transport system permease protein
MCIYLEKKNKDIKKNKEKKPRKNKVKQITDYAFNYVPGNSLFHQLHPITKIIWFFLMTLFVLLQNSLIILTAIMLSVFIMAKLNGIGFRTIFKKLRWIIIFIVLMIVLNIIFNASVITNDPVLFYIIYPYLPVRRYAVYFAFRTAIWILTLSTCGVIFLITTPPKDLIYGLRKLGLPYKIAFSIIVGLRYIPLIQNNTNAVIIAQKARGLERSNVKTFRRALELVKDRLTTTLILVFRDANYTSISMELRAFGRFKNRTDLYKVKKTKKDYIFLAVFLFITIFLTLYRFNLIPFIPPMVSIYSLIGG